MDIACAILGYDSTWLYSRGTQIGNIAMFTAGVTVKAI